MFYLAKVQFNYSKDEFLNSTAAEITDMWNTHCEFMSKSENENNYSAGTRMNIEDFPL